MQEYKKIKSFCKDHDLLAPGFYKSGTDKFGVTTYDLRMTKPNVTCLSGPVSHTIEHLIATIARSSSVSSDVVYFGPMGCLTGFYLLIGIDDTSIVKQLVIDWLNQALELTTVPGSHKKECGNFLYHDLDGAKIAIREYLELLKGE